MGHFVNRFVRVFSCSSGFLFRLLTLIALNSLTFRSHKLWMSTPGCAAR